VAARTDDDMKRGSGGGHISRKVIIETWIRLGRGPVSTKTLGEIQRALSERLGGGAVESPASIARLLADEGAELRHPDVIEFDARWREAELQKRVDLKASVLSGVGRDDRPMNLRRAAASIAKLERIRKKLERNGDQEQLRGLRQAALDEKQRAQSLARSSSLDLQALAEQAEIVQWFTIWLQTPEVFRDWLDLRRRSPDFRKRFLTEKSS